MPQIDPEDAQAVYVIAGGMLLLALGLYAMDKAGLKFAVGVSG